MRWAWFKHFPNRILRNKIWIIDIVAYKILKSSRPNSMSYIAVDLGYTIVNKGHKYDLDKLHVRKSIEKMKKIIV